MQTCKCGFAACKGVKVKSEVGLEHDTGLGARKVELIAIRSYTYSKILMSITNGVKVARNGVEMGEYMPEAIPVLLSSGTLLLSDHYWKPGMSGWLLLSQFPMPQAVPPPMPSQATHPVPPVVPKKGLFGRIAWLVSGFFHALPVRVANHLRQGLRILRRHKGFLFPLDGAPLHHDCDCSFGREQRAIHQVRCRVSSFP